MQRRTGLFLILALLVTVVAVACGARSDLPAIERRAKRIDAGVDAREDAREDAPEDAPEDVAEDVPPDVPDPCTPEATNIYVITSSDELFAFLPLQQKFESRGIINCPGNSSDPFSMAVSREGVSHVIMGDGTLWRVSVFDAFCEATPYVPDQLGWHWYGMGYAPNVGDDGETLYVAHIDEQFQNPPLGLGAIDTDTYELSIVGPFSQTFGNALELTPTGEGPLWGYWLTGGMGGGGTLTRINTQTAAIEEQIPLNIGPQSSALAVAWWGASFYIFTNGSAGTAVTRYNTIDATISSAGSLNQQVVGAGVSTCAPQSPVEDGGGAGGNGGTPPGG